MTTLTKILWTLGLILFAAVLTYASGYLWFRKKVNDNVRAAFAARANETNQVVTEAMLQELPVPVQRFLTYAGVVGKPQVSSVRLKMDGRIRADSEQPWMGIAAEEYYTVDPPTFYWSAGATMGPLPIPLARVRDSYDLDGRGNVHVTMLGLVTIDDAHGPEMDQGGLMRYLNEMVLWFPAATLRDNVVWEPVGGEGNAARVTITDRGRSAGALVTFDDQGRITNFTGDRYRDGENGPELVPWSTPISAYGAFAGMRLPLRGAGVWHLDGGELTYIELQITDIDYNTPELY
jgi:hypothetical protein